MKMFVSRGDCPELGLLAAGAHEQQVRIEQPRLALAQSGGRSFRPAIAVAQKLNESLVNRVSGIGIADFGLDHYEWDAIHEQHDVRDDAGLYTAWCVDTKLVDGVKDVSLGMGEVDHLHHWIG